MFAAAALALAALSLAACGAKSSAEKSAEAATTQTGAGTLTCDGKAISGDAGLPANFPTLPEFTYVTAVDKGPTRVVDGFATDQIEGVYNELRDRLKEEQYTILFNEIEKERGDAEISYRSKDKKAEGQIALRSCDNGHLSLHITARPA